METTLTPHRREGLAEIRALVQELDGDVREVLSQVREARDELGSRPDGDRSSGARTERKKAAPPIAFVHIP
jgi:hypothetical protein